MKHLTRNEATFKDSEESTANVESGTSAHPGLTNRNNTPAEHLDWDPVIRAKPFADELRREFGGKEADIEYCLASVVVVCVHS